MPSVKVDVLLERKHPKLAAFVVIPASKVARWKLTGTTTVEGTLDGVPLGRRSLHRWDDERWFIELRRDTLDQLGKGPGDRARLVISIASAALPAELQALIDSEPAARKRWEAHTSAQQRMLREEILGAKSPVTRERRARRALLPEPEPPAPKVPGLGALPRSLTVRIIGERLPGMRCGPYSEIQVGMPQKVGCDPDELVPADVARATWETSVEVREQEGRPAFRGRAVNGPPRQRFLYLTWIGREGRAKAAMFRRAKLRLDAVPADVLAKALRSGVLVGRLALTDCDGMPVCASVRPPAITWSEG